MDIKEARPSVRDADLAAMRRVLQLLDGSDLGWEDAWARWQTFLPPSISREDVRRFVIPRLEKAK